MRTHRSGREVQQGPIRLKNLLKEASEKLKAAGHDDSILDSLGSKPAENEFWQHQGESLAIYLKPGECRIFRLNRTVDEKAESVLSFDSYSGYKAMQKVKNGTLALACDWAHVRRDFVRVGKGYPQQKAWALKWLSRLRELYQLNC